VDTSQSDKIDVTALICTRNRATQLSNVLDSASHLVIPTGLSWEFIVVDNGSSDNTADVVRRYAARLPLRLVREERPGLSNARNRGVDEARGEYICWTDDDVELDPNWLAAYVVAFRRHPEAAVFGGRIFPMLEGPTPAWFAMAKDRWPLETILAARNFGDDIVPVTLQGGREPYGANFALRAFEQRQNKYNPRLGVSPTQWRVGEETDVIYRILTSGGTGWWVPDSKVYHLVPRKRQTLRYVFHYFFLSGETSAYLVCEHPHDNYITGHETSPPPLTLETPGIYRRLLHSVLGFAFHQATRNIDSKLRHLRDFGFYCGVLSYLRKEGTE
jgi:glucosyl-dolichyl phosphate glucuronosyltransferase